MLLPLDTTYIFYKETNNINKNHHKHISKNSMVMKTIFMMKQQIQLLGTYCFMLGNIVYNPTKGSHFDTSNHLD